MMPVMMSIYVYDVLFYMLYSNKAYHKVSNIRPHQMPKLKCFLSRFAVVFAQYIEAKC